MTPEESNTMVPVKIGWYDGSEPLYLVEKPEDKPLMEAWLARWAVAHGYVEVDQPATPSPAEAVPPLPWRCMRCGERRMFTVRFDDPEEGPVVTLDPPCPTYVDCERNGIGDMHEPNETCPGPEGSPWCPLDGNDDYATGDLEGVMASISAYKRGRVDGRDGAQ